jgi:hypothetical protein
MPMKRYYLAVRQILLQKAHLVLFCLALIVSIRSFWWAPNKMILLDTGATISAMSATAVMDASSFLPPPKQSASEERHTLSQGQPLQSTLKQQSASQLPPTTKIIQEHPNQNSNAYFQAPTPPDAPPFAIFYNSYIPTHMGQEGIDNALKIIKEQMHQVQHSDAARWSNQTVTMYYNTIGMNGILTQEYMQNSICQVTSTTTDSNKHHMETTTTNTGNDNQEEIQELPLVNTPARSVNCVHMDHYETGHEHVTLQRLYEYCQVNPTHRVSYLHPKGSFHKYEDGKNDRWRQRLTSATTHRLCLDPPNKSCNVCSLHFYPMWAPFMPGNMWTAQCSYIRKLKAPLHFDDDMDRVADHLLQLQQQHQLGFHLYNISDEDKLCRGRYSAECWIGSHPDLKPCELSDTANLIVWMMQGRSHEPFQFSMSPTTPIHGPWFQLNSTIKKQVLRDPAMRKREGFLLPGNIIKWYLLYNQLPPPSSWVWKWFPDAPYWQEGIRKHGPRVVEIFTRSMVHRDTAQKRVRHH